MSKQIINPKKDGYLIFAFSYLREISFSELLQDHNEICKDYTLDFYLDRLGSFVFSKDLPLGRAERVRKIARHYMKYDILFSDSTVQEITQEILSCNYDYILIAETDNLIRAYGQILNSFHRIAKNGTYIRIQDIDKVLKTYKTYFAVKEIGFLKAA
ncbi:MAG: hypothetical protein H7A23_22975 [Leptospiraceae bacterium]|nr:hypothetical protein [Leptospiraceae bacterium]MCP5497429.1 hypothetical protein [Leptospiraceae bacterium]